MPKDLPAQVSPQPLAKADLTPMACGSMDFTAVKGQSAKAPYWSPTPRNLAAPVADLGMLQLIGGDLSRLDGAWQAFFAEASHSLVFRRRSAGSQWLLALGHFDSSSALVWPV